MNIQHKILENFIINLLYKSGLNDYCSKKTAEGVVMASLRGVDSHGIQLVPHYIKEIESGRINKNPTVKYNETSKTTCTIDADHSIGFSSAYKATNHAIKIAKNHGISGVSVHNSAHCGMLAYYTLEAAKKGMFAMAMTNTTPRLIPPNGKKAFLGTNPISWAVPMLNEDPLCYDAATTQITGNKIKLYRRLGNELPEGLAADRDGNPTTDAMHAENLFAFGGYKGFGLSFLVDVLCGALSGMPNSEFVSDMYGSSLSKKRKLGQFIIVFDIEKFRPLNSFTEELQHEVSRLRNLPNTGEKVLAPGDPEKKESAIREEKGIPVDEQIMRQFEILAKKFKIEKLTKLKLQNE